MQAFRGPSIADEQFRVLSKIVREESGIVLSNTKRGLLAARLNRRLRSLNLNTYEEYCKRLEGPNGVVEKRHLVTAITTNVTAFMREAHHFAALREDVFLPLIDAARRGQRLRVWSAACSSGEEAYSIALTLLEMFPDAHRYDVLILATDIDPTMVRRAEEGRYPSECLSPLGPAQLAKYFEPDGTSYVARPELRRIMRFSELNLTKPWPFTGQFDAILCRNVVIYFEEETRRQLWMRFASQMNPGGHLFLGHSEKLDGPAERLFQLAGTTQYRRLAVPMTDSDQKAGDANAAEISIAHDGGRRHDHQPRTHRTGPRLGENSQRPV